jgi:dTDP-4-dehydrorhamnose 3,5-epimerase
MHGEPMTKLVGVASGTAHGVYLDARPASPTRGTIVTLPLEVGMQMLVPPGVCNGFQATTEEGCEYIYCFDGEWTPAIAGIAVNPLDPALGINWPIPVDVTDPATISAKDATAPLFADLL